MRNAEDVTFGGSGLDRAAEIRSAPADWGAPFVLPLWRGRVAVDAQGRAVALPADHPVVRAQMADAVLLGRDEAGQVWLAVSVPDWGAAPPADVFFDPSEAQHPDLPEGHRFVELRAVMTQLSPREAEMLATARALFEWHRTHRYCARCGSPSQMIEAGWQRICPECGARHFPRTDPVVIMLITHGNSVLLGRSPGWPEGMYSLLAGFVEPGETVEAAVRRETREETGIRVGDVAYLASQPWAFPMSLMIGCHGHATSTEMQLDPAEIEDALWLSREDAVRVRAGQHPVIRPPRKGAIAEFLMARWLADRLD